MTMMLSSHTVGGEEIKETGKLEDSMRSSDIGPLHLQYVISGLNVNEPFTTF